MRTHELDPSPPFPHYPTTHAHLSSKLQPVPPPPHSPLLSLPPPPLFATRPSRRSCKPQVRVALVLAAAPPPWAEHSEQLKQGACFVQLKRHEDSAQNCNFQRVFRGPFACSLSLCSCPSPSPHRSSPLTSVHNRRLPWVSLHITILHRRNTAVIHV